MEKMFSEQESQKTEPTTVMLLEEVGFESTTIVETMKKMMSFRLVMDTIGATADLRALVDVLREA